MSHDAWVSDFVGFSRSLPPILLRPMLWLTFSFFCANVKNSFWKFMHCSIDMHQQINRNMRMQQLDGAIKGRTILLSTGCSLFKYEWNAMTTFSFEFWFTRNFFFHSVIQKCQRNKFRISYCSENQYRVQREFVSVWKRCDYESSWKKRSERKNEISSCDLLSSSPLILHQLSANPSARKCVRLSLISVPVCVHTAA